jgi:uncharacterized protein
MKFKGRARSTNVEDRRGGGGGRGKAIGGLGIGGIVVLVIYVLLGGDPEGLIDQGALQGGASTENYVPSAEEEELAEFVMVTLKDTETVWHKLFREQLGDTYSEPTLVLFSGSVSSACGNASAATGPFYCGADKKLYIDLSFYKELKDRFKAPGDFAMAYVVAHEVAHHVQNLQGTTTMVHKQHGQLNQKEYNKLSVKLELQADFLAGVWAHYAEHMLGILEAGDIEEALNAANAIGDDRIQKMGRGVVVPDAFTHGSSEQRVRWFKKGYESGNVADGDTFNARNL